MAMRNLMLCVAGLIFLAGCNPPGPSTADTRDGGSIPSPTSPPNTNAVAQGGAEHAEPANDAAQPGDGVFDVDKELQALQRSGASPDQILIRVKSLLEKAPTHPQVLATAMAAAQNVGIQSAQAGDAGKAYPLFLESAKYADKLWEVTEGKLPREAVALIGTVYYNEACAYGINGDKENALRCLSKAIDHGFDNLSLLKNDVDLQILHGTPELDDVLAGVAERARKAAEERAENAFAEFTPFDFDFAGLQNVENDGKVSLADHQGKILIVDFWGTWCPPCRAEIPHFVELQKKYGEQGLQIIGLNYNESGTPEEQIAKIRQFMASNDMNYPCALGDEPTRAMVPGFQGYPTTLFIDRTGKVRLSVVGLRPLEELEAYVTKLLSESAS